MSKRTAIVLDESAVPLARAVSTAAATEKGLRPVLEAVWFDDDAIVATDSYQLAVGWIEGRSLPGIGLPAKHLRAALPSSGDFTVWRNGGKAVEFDDGVQVASVEPVTEYPNWRKILDSMRWTHRYTFDRDALLDVAKDAARGLARKHRGLVAIRFDLAMYGAVPVSIHVANDAAGLPATLDRPRETRTLPTAIDHLGPAPKPVMVNAKFLRAVIDRCREDTIALEVDADQDFPSGPGYRGASHRGPISVREPGLSQLLMPVYAS